MVPQPPYRGGDSTKSIQVVIGVLLTEHDGQMVKFTTRGRVWPICPGLRLATVGMVESPGWVDATHKSLRITLSCCKKHLQTESGLLLNLSYTFAMLSVLITTSKLQPVASIYCHVVYLRSLNFQHEQWERKRRSWICISSPTTRFKRALVPQIPSVSIRVLHWLYQIHLLTYGPSMKHLDRFLTLDHVDLQVTR